MGWSATVLAVPAHRSLTYPGGKAGPVTFQGKTHRQGCSECHRNGIFPVMRQGAETMTMEKIEKGTQCGACHNGQMAFGIAGNCAGCHRPPQDR
jgi:c(7)-type cytochrome triheme protein